MINNYIATKDIVLYSSAVRSLRRFFLNKNFVEVHTQDRLSILAACEDPTTVATFEYAGERWPLPQTGQMWLEYELLKNPALPGVFCVSTSYRAEKNPVPGRHEIIFPMFEFESRGGIDDLRELEVELCEHLGFGLRESFVHQSYEAATAHYGTDDITSREELRIADDFGPVFFLGQFPVRTSPFWNMRKDGDYARKIDVILHGMETIGSAERSSDSAEMREQFYAISGGRYAGLLHEKFGRERVEREFDGFLSFNFFPRFGGGIGMTRLIRALKMQER
ncbi:MAG: amino acid--tRNA ligase-related protein [bacterium]|nr:amino acid--tRNA ligase-related protein [bacterium]MDZ4284951.1 amino acid--tRNA ligase-related protein [Patescibacteria group bacterium]